MDDLMKESDRVIAERDAISNNLQVRYFCNFFFILNYVKDNLLCRLLKEHASSLKKYRRNVSSSSWIYDFTNWMMNYYFRTDPRISELVFDDFIFTIITGFLRFYIYHYFTNLHFVTRCQRQNTYNLFNSKELKIIYFRHHCCKRSRTSSRCKS